MSDPGDEFFCLCLRTVNVVCDLRTIDDVYDTAWAIAVSFGFFFALRTWSNQVYDIQPHHHGGAAAKYLRKKEVIVARFLLKGIDFNSFYARSIFWF